MIIDASCFCQDSHLMTRFAYAFSVFYTRRARSSGYIKNEHTHTHFKSVVKKIVDGRRKKKVNEGTEGQDELELKYTR